MPSYFCPDCGGSNVLTYSMLSYLVNTDDYYCESVKASDADAPASCLDCDWKGARRDLVVVPVSCDEG